MIKRIELTNFMSHEHSVIEPAEGLTVLVGPNNCGKSAVVAALQILAFNENSKYVLRHGEKECAVRVETDDGHVIEWRRKRDSPRYTIDGELFDRLGRGGTPEVLAKTLRLAKVGCADRDTDVHFGDQKRPIFLLDASEQQAAQFFASSSDASRFVEMQALHKQKSASAARDKTRLEAEAARLNRQLQTLEPLAELDEQLRLLELMFAELGDLAQCIHRQSDDVARLQLLSDRQNQYQAQSDALAKLSPPPVLEAEEPLAALIVNTKSLLTTRRRESRRLQALEALPSPPELSALDPLEGLLRGLATADRAHRRHQNLVTALSRLTVPPSLHDVASLAETVACLKERTGAAKRRLAMQSALSELDAPPDLAAQTAAATEGVQLLARLRKAVEHRDYCHRQNEVADQQLQDAQEAIRQWASQGQVCDACGSPIDANRLMERMECHSRSASQ